MTRTTYFKAAATDLAAPYYAGRGGLYLPGTEHTPDYLDTDASKSCTHGLYFCSHQRVAARWGPVVLQVEVLGEKIKTDERVRPSKQPDGIRATKYNKYRTDHMRILRIVGVTGYAGDLDWSRRHNRSDLEQSRQQALENVRTLNTALIRAGLLSVTFPDRVLERLRDDRFNLWEIEDPNAVDVSRETSRRRPEIHKLKYELSLTADHLVEEAELLKVVYDLDGIHAGSARAQRVVHKRV